MLLGIVTAEALYPVPYDPGVDTASDLAAMRPENLVRQPSAAIFNGTMILFGLCIGLAGLLLHRAERRWAMTLPILALAAGMVSVGFVDGSHRTAHPLIAMLAGAERWIVYTVVLWPVVLGSTLIAGSAGRRARR